MRVPARSPNSIISCSELLPRVSGDARDEFGDRLAQVFRHRPLPGSQLAIDAAELAERAAECGKFWKAHVALMTRSVNLQQQDLDEIARELDLPAASSPAG